MADPSLAATIAAILSALKNAAAIQAVVGATARVYGHVPQGDVTSPYLVIADMTVTPQEDKSAKGVAVQVAIEAWSARDYRGFGDVLECLDAIYSTLHRGALTITGNTHTLTRFESAETARAPDGVGYFARANYTVLVRGT